MDAAENTAVDQSQNYNDSGYNNGYNTQNNTTYSQNNAYANTDWRANISPHLQAYVQQFNNANDFVNAYSDVLSLLDKSPANWNDRDIQAYTRLQEQYSDIPSNVKGYDIDTVSMPENYCNTLNDQDVRDLKNLAHEMRLNRTQAQMLYNYVNHIGNNIMAVAAHNWDKELKQYGDTIRMMWGNAIQSKLQNVDNCINHVIPQLVGESPETIKALFVKAGAHVHPVFLKLWAAIGSLAGEGRSQGYATMAPQDANMRLEHMKNSPEIMKIMTNPRHPQYHAINNEFRTLLNIKNRGM